jgi:glutamine---fructose-6-phosphate transaminase (isomerizing)
MTTALERQIRSQPEELERILTSHQTREQVHVAAEGLHRAHRIWIVGTGTSLHAAEIGALLLAESGRGAVVLPAMRFVTMAPVIGPRDTIVVVTHTAETAYALAARSLAFENGIDTIMMTRRGAGFPHMIETVDKETAETYTVSYTTTVMAFAMLAQELGAEGGVSADDLALVPAAVANAIEAPGIDDISPPDRLLVIAGAGPAAITAAEGALKAREGARLIAEGFDIEYLLHGNAVPLEGRDRVLTIGPPDEELLAAVRQAASAAGVPASDIREPSGLPMLLAQIPLAVRLQILALRMAEARGQDPDTVIVGPWADAAMWRIGAPQA